MVRSEGQQVSGSRPHDRRLPRWAWLFLPGVVLYFAAFYTWNPQRWLGLKMGLSWLLVPEAPLAQWVGGSWSRFMLLDRLPIVLAAAAICFLAWVVGTVTLGLLRAQHGLTGLERFVLAMAIGLNALSTFTLLVGLFGGLRSQLIFASAAAAILLIGWFRRESFALVRQPQDPQNAGGESNWLTRLALLLSLPFALLILLGGMLPPWHFDVREYHAQVPKEWFGEGAVDFLPHNIYGNMPLAAEMFSLLGMVAPWRTEAWWWGTLVGKTIIASFAPLAALSVYAIARRFWSSETGAVASFVFVSTPWIAFVSMAGLIDGASAFFAVVTLQAILLTIRGLGQRDAQNHQLASTPGERSSVAGRAAVAGYLAGAAVACKYPALLFVVAPASVWLLAGMLRRRAFSWQVAAAFGFAVVLGCGLWLGKNVALTGNPTYPLLVSIFGGQTRTAAKDAQWNRAHRAPEGGFSLASARSSAAQLLIASQYTSPLVVPLVLVGLFARRHRWLIAALALFGLYTVLSWWLLTHRLERFLIPQLPLAAILAGVGATRVRHPFWRGSIAVFLIATCLANLTLVASRAVGDNRFFVSLNGLRLLTEDQIGEHNPHVNPIHLFLNREVEPGYRVLCCGDAQVFNLRVPVLYNTCFDDCLLESILKDKSKEERLATLRDLRISHIFVDWHELDRYRSPGNYGYSDYVTRPFIRDELFREQQLVRPLQLPVDPENSQVFEVVGWRSWSENPE